MQAKKQAWLPFLALQAEIPLSENLGCGPNGKKAHRAGGCFYNVLLCQSTNRACSSLPKHASSWGRLHKQYVQSTPLLDVRYLWQWKIQSRQDCTWSMCTCCSQDTAVIRAVGYSHLRTWVQRSSATLHVWISKMQELPCLSVDCFLFCTSTALAWITHSIHCSATEGSLERKTRGIRRVERIKGAQGGRKDTSHRAEDNVSRMKHQHL